MDYPSLFAAASRELYWVIPAALTSYALLTLLRHAYSDADFGALAAVRRYPAREAFKGKVVVITGASSGIGEALAYEFARGGATVVLCARRMEELMRVAAKCLEEGSPDSEAVQLDVTAFGKHEAVVEYILRKYKRIDYLCNNAGRSQRGLVESTPLSVDQELFTLNVFGTMSVTKAVLKHTLGKHPLHIVNTSSVAGKVGSPVSASYAASKHALQGFMDTVRMEVGWRGVKVTNCCPGPVESEITLHSFTDTPGKEMGVRNDGSKRMPAERCALLMAAAVHAGLEEVWLAPQPILFFVYAAQYLRGLYFLLSPRLGKQRVEGFKGGKIGYNSLSISAALGGGKGEGKGEGEGGGKKD